MNSLESKAVIRIKKRFFTEDLMNVELMDGWIISAPQAWYMGLFNATKKERSDWSISAGGYGIHWEIIDEDLRSEGLLIGAKSPEFKQLAQ